MKRKLKVYQAPGDAPADLPCIRLQGRWLEKLGYHPGQNIVVREEKSRLIIERAEEDKEKICE